VIQELELADRDALGELVELTELDDVFVVETEFVVFPEMVIVALAVFTDVVEAVDEADLLLESLELNVFGASRVALIDRGDVPVLVPRDETETLLETVLVSVFAVEGEELPDTVDVLLELIVRVDVWQVVPDLLGRMVYVPLAVVRIVPVLGGVIVLVLEGRVVTVPEGDAVHVLEGRVDTVVDGEAVAVLEEEAEPEIVGVPPEVRVACTDLDREELADVVRVAWAEDVVEGQAEVVRVALEDLDWEGLVEEVLEVVGDPVVVLVRRELVLPAAVGVPDVEGAAEGRITCEALDVLELVTLLVAAPDFTEVREGNIV